MRLPIRVINSFFSLLCLSGCGLSVPHIGEVWDRDDPSDPYAKDPIIPITASGQIEYEINKNVYCALRDAVSAADVYFNETKYKGKTSKEKLLPDEWGIQAALSLQVDENIGLNPGISLNTPLPNAITTFLGQVAVTTAQTSAVALGGTLSSTASRTDKFNSYWTVGYLRKSDSDAVAKFQRTQEIHLFLAQVARGHTI